MRSVRACWSRWSPCPWWPPPPSANRAYRSVLTFWNDVIEKMPDNAGAWVNVGNAFGAKRRPSRRRGPLSRGTAFGAWLCGCARESSPTRSSREARPEEAIGHYRDVLAHYPAQTMRRGSGLGLAAYRAGNARLEAGHLDAAIRSLSDGRRPGSRIFPMPTSTMAGRWLNFRAQPRGDARSSRPRSKLDPNSADVHNNLGGLLAQAGRLPEARAQFEAALKLRPDYGQAAGQPRTRQATRRARERPPMTTAARDEPRSGSHHRQNRHDHIAAAAFWCFWPALRGGWLWDDDLEILRNPFIRDAGGWWKPWVAPAGMDYFPLKDTLHWFQWRLWGDSLLGYHLFECGVARSECAAPVATAGEARPSARLDRRPAVCRSSGRGGIGRVDLRVQEHRLPCRRYCSAFARGSTTTIGV